MNTDSLYRVAVDERYRVLRRALRVAVSRPDWGLRLEQIAAIRHEIRALVRVRWFVRRAERTQAGRRDPGWLNYHDHQARGPVTEPELFAGYGLEAASDALSQEGDPAFNGAFDRW